MAEGETKYDVTVLSRAEVTTFPKIGQALIVMQVTYVAAGLPPHTLFIPKDEYSAEYERKAIREDVDKRLAAQPESYRV